MKKLFALLGVLLLAPTLALANCQVIESSGKSNIIRVKITSSSTGNGLTGLTFSSAGLRIGTIADVEATTTAYTQAGSTTETITTLGTYAAPTATKARFKEVDATSHPGIYEIQLADARFAVANSKSLLISITGATGMMDVDCNIPLVRAPSDFWNTPTFAELSGVPGATPTAAQMIQWVYEVMRHKITQTASTQTLFKADSSTTLSTSTTTKAGGTTTRGKFN